MFFDEIEPTEIPGLYAQCHIGIVALDARHKTHNIPGKFLSYMQSGLPVLACVNHGNDLVELIYGERVGHACTEYSVESLQKLAESIVDDMINDVEISERCRRVSRKYFSANTAVNQIMKALHN
jgi:hypothetical protein